MQIEPSKARILADCIERMAADAEDKGKDSFGIHLSLEDARMITRSLSSETKIVRCQECTHYNGHWNCDYFDSAVLDDDFCSCGERKLENGRSGPKMKKINDYLTTPDLLCQLAEEASELAQAALKLKRAMEGTNPTPMSVEECVANMDEEIADVSLLVDLLGYNTREHMLAQGRVAQWKVERWLKRLEEAEGGGTNAQTTQDLP